MAFPVHRMRRLRSSPALRRMVRETTLAADDFILPLFVRPGREVRRPIEAMPGCFQLSVDQAVAACRETAALGVPAVILFGIPDAKDERGTGAYAPDGIVQTALRAIKAAVPELVLITDVCLCEYTAHGHCGVLKGGSGFRVWGSAKPADGGRRERSKHPQSAIRSPQSAIVDNDATLDLLAQMAVTHAQAGADIVAPSDMMDGRVAAIRRALDQSGFSDTAILAYAAKYASSFYGPFREAAESAPAFGDRRAYQMDPPNAREGLREIQLDIDEGADLVMVKPALAYLDVLRRARERFDVPLVAYNVSGEYAMVKAAAARGWLDEKAVALEILTAIKRAGADLVLTYWANDAARWLEEAREGKA